MKRKILSLILAVSFAAAAFSGCGETGNTPSSTANSSDGSSSVSEAAEPSEKSDTPEESAPEFSDTEDATEPATVGSYDNGLNGVGNLVMGGRAVTDGEWIYYTSNEWNGTRDLRRRTFDGQIDEVVEKNLDAQYMNLYDGYLYYIDTDNCMVRIPMNGSGREILYEGTCDRCIVSNGWIYFTAAPTEDMPGGIYKMTTEGAEKTLVVEQDFKFTYNLILDDGWLYYISREDDSSKIFRVKTDGTQKEGLDIPFGSSNFLVHNGWIYTCYCRERVDGSETVDFQRPLTQLDNMNILGDKLYYELYGVVDKGLFRSNLDGTEEEMLTELGDKLHIYNIYLVGDKIFYSWNNPEETFYWENLDGTPWGGGFGEARYPE